MMEQKNQNTNNITDTKTAKQLTEEQLNEVTAGKCYRESGAGEFVADAYIPAYFPKAE